MIGQLGDALTLGFPTVHVFPTTPEVFRGLHGDVYGALGTKPSKQVNIPELQALLRRRNPGLRRAQEKDIQAMIARLAKRKALTPAQVQRYTQILTDLKRRSTRRAKRKNTPLRKGLSRVRKALKRNGWATLLPTPHLQALALIAQKIASGQKLTGKDRSVLRAIRARLPRNAQTKKAQATLNALEAGTNTPDVQELGNAAGDIMADTGIVETAAQILPTSDSSAWGPPAGGAPTMAMDAGGESAPAPEPDTTTEDPPKEETASTPQRWLLFGLGALALVGVAGGAIYATRRTRRPTRPRSAVSATPAAREV